MPNSQIKKATMMFLPALFQQRLKVLGSQISKEVALIGDPNALQPNMTALLCSAKAPASILLAVHDLAQQWRNSSQTIISGFHSQVEQEAFEVLLRGPAKVIYCPARSLPRRLKPTWQDALTAGALCIISPFPNYVRRATKETATLRNRFIVALASQTLIAYAHPGSSSEQLAHEAMSWGKSIYTLKNEANRHLTTADIPTIEI